MYSVRPTKQYQKSLKKLVRSGMFDVQEADKVVRDLASGKSLPTRYCDHKLRGSLSQYRECHIRPDVLLIYKIEKKELVLVLINIGSHSDFFK